MSNNPQTDDPIGDTTPETARALLWRHGLPEDVIDGALCLHAQELAAAIRAETETLKAHGVLEPRKYRPCRDAANQIDPTCNVDDPAVLPAVPVPRTTHATAGGSGRQAEAELYVLLRKAGEDRYEAQALIDRHRDEVLHRAELRRMAAEAQQQPDTETREETGAALARYIADRPVSEIQAAFRVLGWPPLRFELVDVEQPVPGPGRVADEEQGETPG